MTIDDEAVDTPLEGSAFARHFAFDYLTLDSLPTAECKLLSSPSGGCYRSTGDASLFPHVTNHNPIKTPQSPNLKPLVDIIENYEDVFFCLRDPKMENLREMYCAHALNHGLKSRKLVLKNNTKAEKSGLNDSLRDQGFHRARILILLPTRDAARRTVNQMLRLMPKGSTVSHRKRFQRDFGLQEGQLDEDKKKGKKPDDYKYWFSGNCDDRFRIGIALSKKSVKLYSAFADSDIILASPLGLETLINDKDDKTQDLQYITTSIELLIIDQAEFLLMQNWAAVQDIVGRLNQRPAKPSISLPARIRLSCLSGFGARYRQTLLFSAVNCHVINSLTGLCENFQGLNYFLPIPLYQTSSFSTYLPDKFRVPGLKRPSSKSLTTTSATIAADSSITEEAHTVLDNFTLNLITFGVSGAASRFTSNPLLQLKDNSDADVESSDDDEASVPIQCKRAMGPGGAFLLKTKLPSYNSSETNGRSVPQARLAAFKQRILPRLRRGVDQRVLIYIPDYYDLEELRTILHQESLSFCHIHEYLPDNEAERFRNLFDQGRIRIMLLSERYYFFRRRKIRGARNFVFYGPPTFPWFVKELLATCELAPASATNADGESLGTGSHDSASLNSCNATILYFPPWESSQVSMITGNVDT